MEFGGIAVFPFIAITPRSTLAWSGITWYRPIYGLNRTVWYLNWERTNDLYYIELLEIEQLDHLTVCKQMTDI